MRAARGSPRGGRAGARNEGDVEEQLVPAGTFSPGGRSTGLPRHRTAARPCRGWCPPQRARDSDRLRCQAWQPWHEGSRRRERSNIPGTACSGAGRVLVAAGAQPGGVVVRARAAAPARRRGERPAGQALVAEFTRGSVNATGRVAAGGARPGRPPLTQGAATGAPGRGVIAGRGPAAAAAPGRRAATLPRARRSAGPSARTPAPSRSRPGHRAGPWSGCRSTAPTSSRR